MFWLIPTLIVLFVFFERRRRRALDALIPLPLAEKRLGISRLSPFFRFLFFLLGVSCLIMSMLKPYSDYEIRTVKRKGVDLYLLLDLSTSMLAADIKPNRLERARLEIMDFLDILQGDRVGLIGFAGESFTFVPLTHDYQAFTHFLSEISPPDIPVQGTDIAGAIEKANAAFKRQSSAKEKAVILITDGEDSVGLNESVIDDLKELEVKVFVIGLGTVEGAPVPQETGGYKTDAEGRVVISKLNEEALQNLALSTGGGYVRSVSGDLDWQQIYFSGIKKSFEEQELSSREKKIPHYRFQIFLFLAFIFFAAEILLTSQKRYWANLILRRKVPILAFFLLWPFAAHALGFLDEHRGETAYEKGQYERSLKHYSTIVQDDPHNAQARYNLGNTYYRLGKFAEAFESYKQALTGGDKNVRQRSLYNMGNSLFRQGKLKETLTHYEKALEMDPEDERAKLNHEYVKRLLEKEQEKKEQKQQQQENENDQEKDQQQQGQQQEGQEEQQQGQEQQEKQQQDQQQAQADENQGQGKEDKQAQAEGTVEKKQDFKYDAKPTQWLDSVTDEGKEALRYLIQKQTEGRKKKLERDW